MRIHDNGIDREMTAEEIAEYEELSAQVIAEQEAILAAEREREALRQSAVAKLAALGLSEAEVDAILRRSA